MNMYIGLASILIYYNLSQLVWKIFFKKQLKYSNHTTLNV